MIYFLPTHCYYSITYQNTTQDFSVASFWPLLAIYYQCRKAMATRKEVTDNIYDGMTLSCVLSFSCFSCLNNDWFSFFNFFETCPFMQAGTNLIYNALTYTICIKFVLRCNSNICYVHANDVKFHMINPTLRGLNNWINFPHYHPRDQWRWGFYKVMLYLVLWY